MKKNLRILVRRVREIRRLSGDYGRGSERRFYFRRLREGKTHDEIISEIERIRENIRADRCVINLMW